MHLSVLGPDRRVELAHYIVANAHDVVLNQSYVVSILDNLFKFDSDLLIEVFKQVLKATKLRVIRRQHAKSQVDVAQFGRHVIYAFY